MALFRPAGEGRRLRTQVAPAATGTAHTSTAKKSEANTMQAIDGALLALTLGATFVARSFSGDKAQLVLIIQAGLAHRGFACIDITSPCVTFNDHDGSTKSYAYTREHKVEVVQADFVPTADEISADYEAGSAKNVMMHDGSWIRSTSASCIGPMRSCLPWPDSSSASLRKWARQDFPIPKR